MFRNLSITTKFFIIGSAIFIILSIFLAVFVNDIVHKLLINRSKFFIADFVKLQAKDHLTSQNFNGENAYLIFDNFLKEIKTDEVLRIKVWDNMGTVIYSDDKLIIGKNFADNREYNEAMLGKVEAEVKKPAKTENRDEQEYSELLEIYVPILFSEDKPHGVIEIYYKLDNIKILIKEVRMKIFAASAASILALFLFLWISIKLFVKNPLIMLKGAADEIIKGNLDRTAEVKSKDEIGTLAKSFNELVIKLKLKQNELKKANSELEQKVKERIGPYDSKIKELEEKSANLEKIRDNLEEKLKLYL